MNKQEAIKYFEAKKNDYIVPPSDIRVSIVEVIDIINQIDERPKVKIPQYVANWIEEHKARFSNLYTVYSWLGQQKNEVSEWINSNIDLFARAWLDGYEVE